MSTTPMARFTIQPDMSRFAAAIKEAAARKAACPAPREFEAAFMEFAKTTTMSQGDIVKQLREMAADNDREAMLATLSLWRQGALIPYRSVCSARHGTGTQVRPGLVTIHPETIRRCAKEARR